MPPARMPHACGAHMMHLHAAHACRISIMHLLHPHAAPACCTCMLHVCCLPHPRCMHVACLFRYAAYPLHACCMYVACLLHVCYLHVACMLHACCVPVACVLHGLERELRWCRPSFIGLQHGQRAVWHGHATGHATGP